MEPRNGCAALPASQGALVDPPRLFRELPAPACSSEPEGYSEGLPFRSISIIFQIFKKAIGPGPSGERARGVLLRLGGSLEGSFEAFGLGKRVTEPVGYQPRVKPLHGTDCIFGFGFSWPLLDPLVFRLIHRGQRRRGTRRGTHVVHRSLVRKGRVRSRVQRKGFRSTVWSFQGPGWNTGALQGILEGLT